MNFRTISAILRQEWLINADFAQQHLALALRMANGERVEFGQARDESTEPVAIIAAGGFMPAAAATPGVYGVRPSTNLSQLPVGSIAQVDIIGPVLKYGDVCSYGISDIAALVDSLAQNGNVSAIILNIDSPGGQVSGTAMMADSVKAATARKPVMAVINDGMAASAAMWIASAASEIYVTKKTDQVGSIGVYTSLADWYGFAKAQGLNIRDIYAPQSTDKNGTIRQALAGNDAPLTTDLSSLADTFIQTIKDNRGAKLTGDGWQTGKMFKGKEAAKMGLIDGIKSYPQVVSRAQQLVNNRTNQKTSNMSAFAKFMATAGITEIAVVDGGFLVNEETLTAIETALANNETAATNHQAAVDALNATIAERDNTIQALQSVDHQAAVDALNATIAERDNTIQSQAARITELEAKPAGAFRSAVNPTGGDHNTGAKENKFRTSIDEEKERIIAAAAGPEK